MNERLNYTLSIMVLLIFIGLYSTWFVTTVAVGLCILSTMFGVTANRNGWIQ